MKKESTVLSMINRYLSSDKILKSIPNTLFTDLGVFEHFAPKIDSHKFDKPILFLANIQPSLQMDVINQMQDPSLIVMDTMNLWINNNLDDLFKVIRKVDILLINDEEAVELTGIDDITGQIFTMLILTVAAAEAAIGLAIIVAYYRNRGSIRVEEINQMRG